MALLAACGLAVPAAAATVPYIDAFMLRNFSGGLALALGLLLLGWGCWGWGCCCRAGAAAAAGPGPSSCSTRRLHCPAHL